MPVKKQSENKKLNAQMKAEKEAVADFMELREQFREMAVKVFGAAIDSRLLVKLFKNAFITEDGSIDMPGTEDALRRATIYTEDLFGEGTRPALVLSVFDTFCAQFDDEEDEDDE